MPSKPARHQFTVLKQICQLIPPHLAAKLARKHKIASRTITPWNHLVSLLYAQLTHAIGLNDACDALANHRGKLAAIRGAAPPSRNGLSNANRSRDAAMAEDLFWTVLDHLQDLSPEQFAGRKNRRRMPRRFKRDINVVDASTIALVANCLPWAKHRRRKAAAKLHLRLDLQSFLPRMAIIDTAKHNDNLRARELCAGLRDGEIVIFDKAYLDFEHLHDMNERGVFWVSRAKGNMQVRVVGRLLKKPEGKVLRDDIVVMKTESAKKKYPGRFRRVIAIVEVDGKETVMTFISNNLEWAASSICDLYQARWSIETFFKQIKQTLQLSDFLGHNRNAIQWQVWTALLAYVLLRFLHAMSDWNHSFTRLFTVVRGVLWSEYNLLLLLKSYGTAGGSFRMLAAPDRAWLPGLAP